MRWPSAVLFRISASVGFTDRKCRDHVMDSDIWFVREFIFDRFDIFDVFAAQTLLYLNVFSRFVDDADVISVSLQLQDNSI